VGNLDIRRSTAAFGNHCGENESTIHFSGKSEDKIKRGLKASASPDAKICVSSRGGFLEKFERTLCLAGRWK
jgi:hypothetical protein